MTKPSPISNSKLSDTILKINPGISRNLDTQLKLSNKLIQKQIRSADYDRNKISDDSFKLSKTRDKGWETLDGSAQSSINKYKEQYRAKEKQKQAAAKKNKRRDNDTHSQVGSLQGSLLQQSQQQEESANEWQDLSRRSSLKSSVLDGEVASRHDSPEPTEDPLNVNRKPIKPELLKASVENIHTGLDETHEERGEEEEEALMGLLPAPTPTRFVGKVMMKMEENRIKKTSSRRSSIAPTTETIAEEKTSPRNHDEDSPPVNSAEETPVGTPSDTPRSKTSVASGFSGSVLMVGKMKLKTNDRRDSNDSSNSRLSSPREGSQSSSVGMGVASGWLRGRKPSMMSPGSGKEKRGSTAASTGLSTLKAKASLLKKKKKESEDSQDSVGGIEENQGPGTVKQRLFFVVRKELTDEEIIKKIGSDGYFLPGGEEITKEIGTFVEEVVATATYLNRFIKPSQDQGAGGGSRRRSSISGGQSRSVGKKSGGKSQGAATSSLADETVTEQEIGSHWFKGLPVSTRFLGKMVSKRDKHGLVVGTPPLQETEGAEEKPTNPVFLALEKIKLRPQSSIDSSGAESRISVGVSNLPTEKEETSAESGNLERNEVIRDLHNALSRVRHPTIPEWNIDKHVRGDREFKPIFVGF